MNPTTGLGITTGNKQEEIENKDPFVLTPPRKHNSEQYAASTTPATPKSTSTPLHKRFLEEVTMSPGASSTPPRTPTHSPKRGQAPKPTLEVGQNGFYFSMEIPEKKITPRRAATPDSKAAGRVTPSPEKQKRSEVKTGGRVRDILRKNLFGTPTKHTLKPGKEEQTSSKVNKTEENPSKAAETQLCAGHSNESASAQEESTEEAVTDHVPAHFAVQDVSMPAQLLTTAASAVIPKESLPSTMPQQQPHTPGVLPAVFTPLNDAAHVLDLRTTPVGSTPSNIGHLMANHSSKSSKVQPLPAAAGLESMPTPLRKMSEKLGLISPNVVRKDRVDEHMSPSAPATPREQMLRSPISALDLHDAAVPVVMDPSAAHVAADEKEATATFQTSRPGHLMRIRSEQRLRQLLPSPITTLFPVLSSRPSPATTPYSSSPSTPSRPGLPRAKSFGTPSRLRSSMQEDMFKMQESLKRSLGPEVFQPGGSRPTTPLSPAVGPTEFTSTSRSQSKGSPQKSARPVSMVGPPKADEVKGTGTVPRRRINTAERKPRPKSMIVGSAKMLETIAAQIDSPRERAKLRIAAATPAPRQNGPMTSRSGKAASTSRVKPAATAAPASKAQPPKAQPPNRANKPAPPRPSVQAKRAEPPAPSTHPAPLTQRTTNTSATVSRPSSQNAVTHLRNAPPPPARGNPSNSPSKPIMSRGRPRVLRTPSPELPDAKKDSGTATSYTPPGNPTRLPSPIKEVSRTRLVVANGALPTSGEVKPMKATRPTRDAKPRPDTKAVQTPVPRRRGAVGVGAGAGTGGARQDGERHALQTPSKEVQSALDRAIDRKIREDRERLGSWF